LNQQLLIDAGMSSHGWSNIGEFIKCPYKNALRKASKGNWWVTDRLMQRGVGSAYLPAVKIQRLQERAAQADNDPNDYSRDPLIGGSMGHTGLAHFYARAALEQGQPSVLVGTASGVKKITDRDQLLPVNEAVRGWVSRYKQGYHLIPMIDKMMAAYQRRYATGIPELVISCERPVVSVIGTHSERGWGIWVLEADTFEVPKGLGPFKCVIGGHVIPTMLACEGHPEDGTPLFLTRRIDLELMTRGVVIIDHKCVAYAEPKRAQDAYSVDRGMVAFRMMGRQLYGANFAGVELNLVEKRQRKNSSTWRVCREPIAQAPRIERTLARRIYDAYHRRAQLEVETARGLRSIEEWPDVAHESGACYHRYGACEWLKNGVCQRGLE